MIKGALSYINVLVLKVMQLSALNFLLSSPYKVTENFDFDSSMILRLILGKGTPVILFLSFVKDHI